MIIVQICVGSACHLKGSQEIVERFQAAIEKYNLEGDVVLSGSFCIGECNRDGVTIQINDEIHTGVTKETFESFFNKYILEAVKKGE